MFDINGTLVIFVVSFLIYMVLLNKMFIQPVATVLENRAKKIQSDTEAGKQARLKAQEILSQYEKRLESTRAQAQAIINQALEKANAKRAEEIARLKQEGLKSLDATKADIASEKSQLLEVMIRQENELVAEMIEKLLGEKVKVSLDPDKVRCVLEEAC